MDIPFKTGYTKTISATGFVERCQNPACDKETNPSAESTGERDFITLKVIQVKGDYNNSPRNLLFCSWDCVGKWSESLS